MYNAVSFVTIYIDVSGLIDRGYLPTSDRIKVCGMMIWFNTDGS
jgi:hypothetical protein